MDRISNRILRLLGSGASIRRISRDLHVSRYKVSKVISSHHVSIPGPKRMNSLDEYEETIRGLLAVCPAMPVSRVHELLKDIGFSGSYTILREQVRKVTCPTKSSDKKHRLRVTEERLKLWLFDLLMSKEIGASIPDEVRGIANLDQILQKARTGSMSEQKRALAILSRSMGFTARTISKCLKMSRSVVADAYSANNRDDAIGPFLAPSRSPKRGDARGRMSKCLIEILHCQPKAYGINRTSWTHQSLADAYEMEHGEKISCTSVREHLKDAGYKWKKSRRVLTSPDPEYREKVELLLQTLQSLRNDEVLFFVDELGPLQVKRYGGRCHLPKKETLTHPQRQSSKGSITLYGALSATTNQVTWLYGSAKDTAAMIDLTEILFNQHQDKSKMFITWDAASWHRSNQLIEWVDDLNATSRAARGGPEVELLPLPHCAQFLNVIESVFSGMKRAVIHNSDYPSVGEMKTAISRHFQDRNLFFTDNPKRAGKRIWEIDFFDNHDNLRSGMYRQY